MNTFFQTLRDIQKKERATGTLSEVDEGFYDDASKYLLELLKIVNDNPLSLEAYQLRDAQRITSEICERREVKIITSAITNVQRSHNLFKGHEENSQLYEEIPYNTTPEEEKLYREVIDTLITHRENLISDLTPKKKKTNKIGFKPVEHNDIPSQEASQIDDIRPEELQSPDNLMDIADIDDSKITTKPDKPKANKLDASQVAMMFGQAPDDVLLDENNEPVKQKSTNSMMHAFKPPKTPEFDTVSLQKDNHEVSAGEDKSNQLNAKSDNQDSLRTQDNQTTSNLNHDDVSSNEDILSDAGVQLDADETNLSDANQNNLDESVVVDEGFNDEELVEFINILPTDVLDEDEKTYGPFDKQDVALLPKSIVKILKNNNVIDLIK